MFEIYVVTHGDKFGGIDPHMTDKGFAQVRALRQYLPEAPETVVCGTGRRHQDVAQALGLDPTRITSVVGDGDSLDVVDDKKIVILTNGLSFKLGEKYTSLKDMEPAVKELIKHLPNKTVICAGRPLMMMLGVQDAKSGAVYKIKTDGCLARSWIEKGIEEVVSVGEVDQALS